MEEQAMTVAEAARSLDVTLHYAYALIWGGQLKARKVDGQWRISAEAINNRLRERICGLSPVDRQAVPANVVPSATCEATTAGRTQ